MSSFVGAHVCTTAVHANRTKNKRGKVKNEKPTQLFRTLPEYCLNSADNNNNCLRPLKLSPQHVSGGIRYNTCLTLKRITVVRFVFEYF
jgi:hypothetical protein